MEEDEGKANSLKMTDRLSNTASNGEVEQKLSLRQKLEHRPWLLIAMIVIIAALIVGLVIWLPSRLGRSCCPLLMTADFAGMMSKVIAVYRKKRMAVNRGNGYQYNTVLDTLRRKG